jgi:hypothetical protein
MCRVIKRFAIVLERTPLHRYRVALERKGRWGTTHDRRRYDLSPGLARSRVVTI